METVIAVGYLIGVLTSVGVGRSRAGLSQLGRLTAGTVIGSLPWFFTQLVSMVVWPVFLTVWLARGRPDSPWESITTSDGTIRVRRRVVVENR